MKWVTSEVLPSIRKTSSYLMPIDVGHKFNNALTFRIENETDLHVKVVSFLKKRFPHSIFVAPLGENQLFITFYTFIITFYTFMCNK